MVEQDVGEEVVDVVAVVEASAVDAVEEAPVGVAVEEAPVDGVVVEPLLVVDT